MFNPHRYDNKRVEGVATLAIVTSTEEDPYQQLADGSVGYMPLARTDLRGRVTGPLAHLSITHTYRHPDVEHGPVLEAVYRFPLPGDAAVTGVQVRFGEVVINAELAERRQAERDYDEARATGRQAALLTRESPDVFTLHVSGIESGEEVTVETAYVQLARAERGGFNLRVPLTPAPRYSGLHEFGSRHAQGQPLALARDPGHRFRLDVTLAHVESVTSPTHDLALEVDGNVTRVRLRAGELTPDRDLSLSWCPAAQRDRPTLQAWRGRDRFDAPDVERATDAGAADDDEWPDSTEYDYFLALISPPESQPAGERIPREVIVLVDRSGSMSGAKWEAADWAVNRFLKSLDASDRFSLGLFHSTTRWFSRATLPATAHRVEDARHFLRRHDDSGGTELGSALAQAQLTERAAGEYSRHVLIITDAQVSNLGGLLDLAKREARRPERRRISVLCIDAAPNSYLVNELVDVGGGRAAFLTSDPEEGDITTALDEVMSWWDAPAATGLALTVNRAGAWVMGRPVRDEVVEVHERDTGTAAPSITRREVSRVDLGDLPSGFPIWVVGRVPASDSTGEPLTIQARDGQHNVIATWPFDDVSEKADNPAIKALFGARRLPLLEHRVNASNSPYRRWEDPSTTHLDPRARERLRKLLVAESLHYGLVSSETAYIAVRTEAGRVVERGALVPNALPAGWDDEQWLAMPASPAMADQTFGLPRMARYMAPEISELRYESASEASFLLDDDQARLRRRERRASRRSQSSEHRRWSGAGQATLFDGVPVFYDGLATLFEVIVIRDAPEDRALRLTGIEIDVHGDSQFDGTLTFDNGDGTAPRASMRLSDVLALGGNRPLNVIKRPGQVVRLTLMDVKADGRMPSFRVIVSWRVD